ncbi:unnamed protein product [Paramecium pentaurelia]|uniref:Uncharacterized protein n=1 Tax=Paramecium pentaurelia TaxID=43138 RepID=A0A8S1YI89_9CILI|nr:unnamed protein product [Paramecium pentaurelia]
MQGSLQEKEALADIFTQFKNVDEEIYGVILKILRKEKVQDCIGYLSDNRNQINLEQQILQQIENITQADMEQKLSVIANDMKQITNVLKKLKDHDFNYKDFSAEEYDESTLSLIQSIKDNRRNIEFLQFLVQLTSIDENLIQCGSNSLHILVQMKVDLSNKNLENIKIQNISLVGANFIRCNFSGSQFNNVNLSGINLNGAQLFNCKLKNLRIHELYKFNGHRNQVRQICFSPDGKTLASGGYDKSIRIWDIKTG